MPSPDASASAGNPLLHAGRISVFVIVLTLFGVSLFGGPAHALEAETDEAAVGGQTGEETVDEPIAGDEARDEQLRLGATVYAQICASCHQAGGVGLEGPFPPLIDNDNVDDATYVESVITNGRQGEIIVNGVTYDGVMPSFSTLSDDDTLAVIAFIQNDFAAPTVSDVAAVGPAAGTKLPPLSNMTYVLAFAMTAGLIVLVLAPRVLSENDRLDTPWLDAWLKAAVIVSGAIILTVIIPDWAVKNSTVTSLSRFAQDLIGVSLWLLGMVVVLWSLWYAHRRSRV